MKAMAAKSTTQPIATPTMHCVVNGHRPLAARTLRLTLTQDGHLRVERFPTTAGAYPDRGWTVAEDWQWPQGQLNFDDAGDIWVLETARWTLSVNKNNGLLSFDTDSGEMYREIDYQIDSPRLNVVLDDPRPLCRSGREDRRPR